MACGELEGLVYDVNADGLAPGGQELLRHRSRLAIAYLTAVDHRQREHAGAGGRKERLVGGVDMVGLQVLLHNGNVELVRQVEDHLPRHALQDGATVVRRVYDAVRDYEHVERAVPSAMFPSVSESIGQAPGSTSLASSSASSKFIRL